MSRSLTAGLTFALARQKVFGARWMATLGIRRENKGRWERRVPLTPDHVRILVDSGVDVHVQPSKLRVFSNQEYERAGAKISEDLSAASTILGVKEVPVEELMADKTYFFFSHTFKAQEYNMPMLDAILEKGIRLIDYERMMNDRGERIVKFGRFAGVAGMMDLLHGLGNRLLGLGYHTPFLYVGLARNYPDLGTLRGAVRSLGNEIAKNGVPEPLNPFTVVFTGNGAVSQGAQEVFNELPHRYVSVEEMEFLVQSGTASRNLAYGVIVEPADYMKHRRYTSGRFSKDHYYQHPDEYVSCFHYKVAPYASAIVNCMYWESRFPRILTTEQIKELSLSKRSRLVGIADITADPNGSLEFMHACTTMDDPFEIYDPVAEQTHKDMSGDGVLMMSVDNLPAELPSEASAFFGSQLLPYIQYYLTDPELKQSNVMARCLQRAMETENGQYAASYQYIDDLRKENAKKRKHVLLLGSGMVAGPVVDHLLEDPNIRITLATLSSKEAEALAKGRDNIEIVSFDVGRATPESLNQLVDGHKLVISMVPATFHPRVAEACVANKTHMVTASYTSPEMQRLGDSAKAAGVILLNEIGLDPGIDHLSAMKIIDEVRRKKGKITSFVSWCGGLPAPEYSDNPLGYKFSWSPRGVLTAGLNAANFRYAGQMTQVAGGQLFQNVDIVPVDPEHMGYNLEGLPNRDAMPYAAAYGIGDVRTMFRGTLRYKGFSRVMRALSDVGLFDTSPVDYLRETDTSMSWVTVEPLLYDMLNFTSDADREAAFRALQGLQLLSDKPIDARGTCLDTLCAHLEKELAYRHGERDMVLLHHNFGVECPNGEKETYTSSLISYGEGYGIGDSAMAKTVGLPVAMAARLILDGQVMQNGVVVPTTPDYYEPILATLAQKGIHCIEKVMPAVC